MLYAFHYFLFVYNASEPRPWTWLRGLRLWDRFHRRHLGGVIWAEGSQWVDYESKGPRVFVVDPGPYALLSIFLTFGLHGQDPKAVKDLSPLLVFPDHMFRYPLIANLIQWAGGVPFDRARLERAVKEDGSSIVVLLPGPSDDDALERGDGPGEDQALAEWLVNLPTTVQQSIKVIPVFYRGADHFYVHPIAYVDLGLFGTCLPRAVQLRAGVNRAILLSSVPDQAVSPGDLLTTMRQSHSHLMTIIRSDHAPP